jgi:hypothetical protein
LEEVETEGRALMLDIAKPVKAEYQPHLVVNGLSTTVNISELRCSVFFFEPFAFLLFDPQFYFLKPIFPVWSSWIE